MLIRKAEKIQCECQRLANLKEKILFLYHHRNDSAIQGLIRNQPINSLIEALESIDNLDIISRFLLLSKKIKMGQFFLGLSESTQQNLLGTIRGGVVGYLLEDLNLDDAYELFVKSPASIQKKIILNSSKELKDEIKEYKKFDFGQVGSIMNTSFISFYEGMNVREAINFLRLKNTEFDIGEEVFVSDSNDVIVGSIQVKELIFSDEKTSIDTIVNKSFMSIMANDDIEDAIVIFKRYAPVCVAVVNEQQQLVGILNYQDIVPEILESTTEDIYKFYGIVPKIKPYLASTVMEIVRSRIVCLIIMLFAATFTTFAIDKFELLGVVATAGLSSAILVPIIPIITDMCGNTGAQTAATVIQGVSAGDLKFKDYKKVISKEVKVAFIIGGILAVINFLRLMVYFSIFPIDVSKLKTSSGNTNNLNTSNLYKISLVGALSSSLSLWMVVVFSKVFGALIPFLAVKFDYDPSSVSSPVLTTIMDTFASIIFFGLGVFLLYFAISPILGVTVSSGTIQSQALVFS